MVPRTGLCGLTMASVHGLDIGRVTALLSAVSLPRHQDAWLGRGPRQGGGRHVLPTFP